VLLTITTTHTPATDLGYLLHKNPAKCQSFPLSFGQAHVFYPEASAERCTAALLLEVDPIGLVRNRQGPSGEGGLLDQYVNDRPYVASSLLSVAIAQVFGSALSGKSKERAALVDTPIALSARLAVVPCRGGEKFLRSLFEPLGYLVNGQRHPLDEAFPDWGDGPYFTVELAAKCRLRELLAHLYVLIPVLDDDKHYWVGDDEVDKLLRHGERWLAAHPERDNISRRYLKHQRRLPASPMRTTPIRTLQPPHTRAKKQQWNRPCVSTSSDWRPWRASSANRGPSGCSISVAAKGACYGSFSRTSSFARLLASTSRTGLWRRRSRGCGSSGCRRQSSSASNFCTAPSRTGIGGLQATTPQRSWR
jgi:3' terminal RNA ribose 2'-O-methyltransferase Hen1